MLIMLKKKLLFVCYGGGHVEIIKTIIENCIDFNKYDVEVIGLTVAYNEIIDKRITKYRLSDFEFLFTDIISDINHYGNELLHNSFNPNANIPESEIRFYLGISFLELISEVGLKLAQEIYEQKKRQAFFPKKTMLRILQHLSPDIVFTTNSPRFEAASIDAAKILNIKNIQILDLFGDDFIKASADYIIVMNEFVKLKLINEGVNSNILPLGQPIFDKTVEQVKKIDIFFIKNKFNISYSKKILLFSPTKYYIWNDDFSLKGMGDDSTINFPIFRILENLIQKFDIEVIVRSHPVYDKIEDYKKYTSNPNIKFMSNDEISLFETLGICDIVLTYISTIGLQGIICNKTVFTYNYDDNQNYFLTSYTKSPFIYSKNYEILEKNLCNYFEKNELARYQEFYKVGSNDKIFDFLNNQIFNLLN
jgi:CDP-glycerol glycerophosphotransferase (TagB/SpsB family)